MCFFHSKGADKRLICDFVGGMQQSRAESTYVGLRKQIFLDVAIISRSLLFSNTRLPSGANTRWTCRRWRNTSSVGEMLDELQWPTLKALRDQSSLLFFNKIHCGTLSIDKDKYLTPSQSTRSTRSSHNSQYCRPQTYSDALKYSFFLRTIPHWNSLAPSVVAAETTEEFRALI